MNGATALVSPGRTEHWPFLSSPGASAVIGIMTAGPMADPLLRSAFTAFPYAVIGTAFLSAQNPPIEASLDIVPSWP